MKYLVGTPESGPFASFTAVDDKAAELHTAEHYGPVQDAMTWNDEDGREVLMFIVR